MAKGILSELHDEFHALVGVAIARWARVDDELFRIFQTCVGPYEQCAIIYFKTPGIDARFSLTSEIVRSFLPKKERKDGGHEHPSVKSWNAAIKDYQKLLGVRRRIAHHPIRPRISDNRHDTQSSEPPIWFEIYVSQNEEIRESHEPLRDSDITKHISDVADLAARLNSFYQNVLLKLHEQ